LPQNFPLPFSTVSQLPRSAKVCSTKIGRGQAGFAIGLILIVVSLLAIVIGAIALGNRGASSVGKQEEERLGASFLLTTGKGFEVQIASYLSANNLKGYQLYAVMGGTDAVRTNVANLWRPRGGLTPPKVVATSYVDTPIVDIHGAGATQGACALNPTNDTDTNGNGCAWHLSRVNLGIGRNTLDAGQQWVGSSLTNDLIVYTFPLRLAVCQQTNNLLFAAPLSDAPVPLVRVNVWGKLAANDGTNPWAPLVAATPAAAAVDSRTAATSGQFTQGGINGSAGATVAAPPTISGEPRNEFCSNANLGLAAGTNIYTYVKTVYVQ
jgi:hypothetical protein